MTQRLLLGLLLLPSLLSACSSPKTGDVDDASLASDAAFDADPPSEEDASESEQDGGDEPVDRDAGDGPGMDAATGAGDAGGVRRDAGPVGPVSCANAPSLTGLTLQNVAMGLSNLVYAAQPPDSTDWYLVEQGGTIRVFSGGQLRAGNILNISSEVGNPVDGGDERGLLGLAFPPDFASSKLFYIMFTPRNQSTNHDIVREYRRTDSGSTLVRTLLDLGASAVNHNGGTLVFGPDGLLYVGTGDGGEGCGMTQGISGASQSPDSRHGKILRLDPKQQNPAPTIAHYGLRNPFRFSFDRVSGDLFIADVGADRFEELDIAPAGSSNLNFGWPAFEGKATFGCGPTLRPGSIHTPPIFDFGRRNNMCTGQLCDWAAIIGGVVYRGADIPRLNGAYIFADYSEPYIVSFYHCSPTMRSAFGTLHRDMLGFSVVPAIVQDNEGEVYFVADRTRLAKLVAR